MVRRNDMITITNRLYLVFTRFNGSNSTCERDRTHRQIRTTFPDVRLHTPGI